MTQPTDSKKNKLTSALGGGRPRSVPQQSDDAFDKEVDEELQREQLAKIWEHYSGYILGAALALILGVIAYKFTEQRRQSAAEAAGARYMAAIREVAAGKPDEGMQALATVARQGGGFGTLAQLRLAGLDAVNGKTAEATAKYDALAATKGLDPLLAGYARLQSATLSLDTASWDDMLRRLSDLTGDANPWRYRARELLGMAALKAGKLVEAKAQFEKLIGGEGVPPGMAERARIVLGSIVASEMAPKVPVTAPAETPGTKPAPPPEKNQPAATPAKK